MKTVLVTGASGFVGGHVVEALARNGIRPRCLVRRTSRLEAIAAWGPELVYGDITDPMALAAAVAGVNGIVHAAGLTRAPSLADYLQVNAGGCGNLYRACLEHNPAVERIVHIGSLAALGPARGVIPVRENAEKRPVSHYGFSKLAGQSIAQAYMTRLPIAILMPPAVYGPQDKVLFPLFACAKRGIAPVIGREERRISLLYVKDLAQAALVCLENRKAAGQSFLLEDGAPHTWQEVMAEMGRCLQTSPVRIRIPLLAVKAAVALGGWMGRLSGKADLFGRDRFKDFLQPSWVCSGEKIVSQLGYLPRYTMERGLAETCRWYRERHWL